MIIVRSVLSFTGTPNNGSLPIGNGQGFTINTLTAGTNITITNGPGTITIDAAGGGSGPAGSTDEIQYNNAGAFAASANFRWIIADNRLLLGTENTADIKSRMVVIGKGISTDNTFAVHNSTGTNNSLIVRDDGRILIGTNDVSQTRLNGYRTVIKNSGGQWLALGAHTSNTDGQIRMYNNTSNQITHIEMLGAGAAATNLAFDLQAFPNGNANVVAYLNLSLRSAISEIHFSPNSTLTTRLRPTSGANIFPFVHIGGMHIGAPTNSTNPELSSILELTSTSRGFLPPRNADPATNIATPAEGLIAFDTTDKKLQVYDGTNWIDLH